MPWDITMCGGRGCPLRGTCYRHRAHPTSRQDWFTRAPYDPERDACDAHWSIHAVIDEEQIRVAAYMIWLNQGRPEGRAEEHWQEAEARAQARLRPASGDQEGSGGGVFGPLAGSSGSAT